MSTNALWILFWSLAGAALGAAGSLVCRQLIRLRHPRRPAASVIVDSLAATVLFGLLAWRLGSRVELVGYSYLAAFAVPLAAIDLAEYRLPSRLVVPLCTGLLITFGTAAAVDRNGEAFVRALAGMIVLSAGYLVVAVVTRGGLGAGDVRLAAPVGLALAWRDWHAVAAGTVIGLLMAGLMATVLYVTQRGNRPSTVPFGPAMLVGAFVAILTR